MDTTKKNSLIENELFQEYNKLIPEENQNSVIVTTEWNQIGDNFKKFSLYDTNYTPVTISSSTSIICEI